MKIEMIWTESEWENVEFCLKQKYGDLKPRTLAKYAVRELVEMERVRHNSQRNAQKWTRKQGE